MWIRREIEARGGEVSFRDYMELALYHPEQGYYTAGRAPWGRDGDYLTAPTASIWYGATMGRLLTELAGTVNLRLGLVDLAAGDGSFLASVLDAAGPGVLGRIVGVERSAATRVLAAKRVAGSAKCVELFASLPGSMTQPLVAHASELYDAMPVHRVEQAKDGLTESTVVVSDDELVLGSRPAGAELRGYFADQGIALEEGQTAEVNLAAKTFHRSLLETLGEGVVLILDYGYEAARLYDPRGRRRGSLATYRRHELGVDPLDSPGERDLTAHVNWDDLRRAATGAGWREIALMPLAEWLVRSGIGALLEERGFGMEAELDAETVSARQEIKRLLDPEGMGSDLKMLVQAKGKLGDVVAEMLHREV